MTDREGPGGRRASGGRAGGRRRLAGVLAVAALAVGAVAFALRAGDAPSRIPVVAPQARAPAGATATGPEAPPPRAGTATDPVRVAAVGDVMMGSTDHGLPPDGGAGTFAAVAGLLEGDLVLGNLEGPLTEASGSKCGPESSGCFAFRTPPAYAAHLAAAGFDVMNLANNHAYDFGPEGLADTLAALRDADIAATGTVGAVAVEKVGSTLVATIGFAPYVWADSLLDLDVVRDRVAAAASRADIVIVTMHAGAEGADARHVRPGEETYLGESRGDVIAFARAAIDAGADLVVGHGPHVLRGMEFHRDRLIAYSLGNFVGYRAFSLSGSLSMSAVLQVRLAPDGRFLDGRLRPARLVGEGRPAPGGGAIAAVRALSEDDFGARAARIAPDGAIRPPGRSRP